MFAADDKMEIDDSLYRLVSMAVLTNIFLVVHVMIKCRVHIVAQRAFRIAILYIYLPGGGSQAPWTGGWAD